MGALPRLVTRSVATALGALALVSTMTEGCVPTCKMESSAACQREIGGDFGTCPDGNAPVLTCVAGDQGYCGIEATCPVDAGAPD
jgi:hypothetical protein